MPAYWEAPGPLRPERTGVGMAAGALWGAVFGAVAHAATRGRRDFVSRSSLAAGSYEIVVASPHATQARTMLTTLPPAA